MRRYLQIPQPPHTPFKKLPHTINESALFYVMKSRRPSESPHLGPLYSQSCTFNHCPSLKSLSQISFWAKTQIYLVNIYLLNTLNNVWSKAGSPRSAIAHFCVDSVFLGKAVDRIPNPSIYKHWYLVKRSAQTWVEFGKSVCLIQRGVYIWFRLTQSRLSRRLLYGGIDPHRSCGLSGPMGGHREKQPHQMPYRNCPDRGIRAVRGGKD